MIIREEAADSSHSPPQATSPSSGRSPHGSATFLNQAPNGRSGRGGDSSPGSPPSRSAPEQGQRKRGLIDSLNQPQGKMTVKEKSLTPLCGWEAVSSVPPSQSGLCELLQTRGSDVIRCFPTALSRLRLARILHHCDGTSQRQTQWAWRQASERFLFNRKNQKERE